MDTPLQHLDLQRDLLLLGGFDKAELQPRVREIESLIAQASSAKVEQLASKL